MNPGGWSPIGTAMQFAVPRVIDRIADEWGEAVWTAPDLFWPLVQSESRAASVRFMFGLPL